MRSARAVAASALPWPSALTSTRASVAVATTTARSRSRSTSSRRTASLKYSTIVGGSSYCGDGSSARSSSCAERTTQTVDLAQLLQQHALDLITLDAQALVLLEHSSETLSCREVCRVEPVPERFVDETLDRRERIERIEQRRLVSARRRNTALRRAVEIRTLERVRRQLIDADRERESIARRRRRLALDATSIRPVDVSEPLQRVMQIGLTLRRGVRAITSDERSLEHARRFPARVLERAVEIQRPQDARVRQMIRARRVRRPPTRLVHFHRLGTASHSRSRSGSGRGSPGGMR